MTKKRNRHCVRFGIGDKEAFAFVSEVDTFTDVGVKTRGFWGDPIQERDGIWREDK
jgi:hypothetical protein